MKNVHIWTVLIWNHYKFHFYCIHLQLLEKTVEKKSENDRLYFAVFRINGKFSKKADSEKLKQSRKKKIIE